MRYVPGLISAKSKILPGYFKGSIYATTKRNPVITVLLWIVACIFFLSALLNIAHPLMTLLFGGIGFILLPPAQSVIENKLRFRLTNPIKVVTALIMFFIAVPMASHYAIADVKASVELANRLNREAAEKEAAVKAARAKKDTLLYYLSHSTNLTQLDKANDYAASDSDRALIGKAKTHIMAQALFAQVKQGKYAVALPAISDLIAAEPNNPELLYQRAVCYSKTGHTADAVQDLAPLVAVGNADAVKLHDKINPLKRHIAYYTTRCRDGSSSSAKGRGACSSHGGVANWNEPVYATSRKY